MPLLDRITEQALDREYAQRAARRRAQGGRSPASDGGGLVVLVALGLFGLLVATAAVQETRTAPVDAINRAQLIDQLSQRRAALAATQDRIGQKQARISVLVREAQDLATQQDLTSARLLRLGGRTGYGPVRGPGVLVQVDDSPSGIPEEAVRDSDLADLVNALWGVGAEAIAINDERVTVLSGLRNVGTAVHLNGKPLSPPYVVEAIGDPRTLQSDLVNSPRGQHFFGLADALGLDYDMSNQSTMLLPAAAQSVIRVAVSGVAVSGTGSGTGSAPDAESPAGVDNGSRSGAERPTKEEQP